MVALALSLVVLAVAAAAPVAGALLRTPPAGLLRTNYRGTQVPMVGGVVLLAGLLAGEAALSVTTLLHLRGPAQATLRSGDHAGLVVAALGFFALGLLDDRADAGHARGFKGHLRALREGHLTGGAIKAAGGAAVALVAAALWEPNLGPALLDAAIVALAANVVNLLDLRPGRATKSFLPFWVVLAATAWGSAYVVLSLPVAGSAAVWLGPDVRGRGMLGDAGANLLGAVLGAGAALTLGIPGRVAVLAVVAALTVASERWSFSAAIDAIGPLRWVDRLGTVR